MYVLWKNTVLQTPSNYLLGCLAVSDALVGLIVKPLYIVGSLWVKQFDYVYCTLRIAYASSAWVCCGVSFLTIDLITFERYIALFCHRRYCSLITFGRIAKAYLLSWVSCIVIVLLMFVSNATVFKSIATVMLLSSFVLTFVTYLRILRLARRHHRQIHQQELQLQRMHSVRQTKFAVTMGCVVGVYLICYTPILTVLLYQSLGSHSNRSVRLMYNWAVTMAFLSSTLNPLIYCWRCRNIRCLMVNTLKQCCCSSRAQSRVSKIFVKQRQNDTCAGAITSRFTPETTSGVLRTQIDRQTRRLSPLAL